MKNYTLSAFILGLIILFSGAAADAQSPNKITARIDFDFHVAGKKFEAGDYVIERVRPTFDSAIYQIRRSDSKSQSMFKVLPYYGTSYSGTNEVVLRFNRYGNQYFLSNFFNKATDYKATLQKDKMELQAAAQFAKGTQQSVAVVSDCKE